MGRELREPPSNEGVLHQASERLLRGRIVAAALSAIVGFASALASLNERSAELLPWRAAPMLSVALALALATVACAVLFHRLPAEAVRARAAIVAALAAFDGTTLGVASMVDRGALLGPAPLLLLGSLLVHARAATRIAARVERSRHESVAHALRESLGIVRARAEALRLLAADTPAGERFDHDLDVLMRQADQCQKALRELEETLALAARSGARLPPRAAPRAPPFVPEEPCPSESTPARS